MIGILMQNIHPSPKNIFAVKNINKLNERGTSSILFHDFIPFNFPVPVKTNMLQRAEAFNFNGTVITDDIMLAQEVRSMVYAKARYLYLYDLDWTRIDNLYFKHLKPLFLNDNIELIARSKTHYKIITDLFKKPKYIMEHWDARILEEIDKNE
mgnify:CR=1 FL=1|jgi:hypothetical protein